MKEKEWESYVPRSDREISWNLLMMYDRSRFGEEEILSAHRKVLEGDWTEADKLIKLYKTCTEAQLLERKKNMEANRDLLKILKNYPEGTKLWSPIYGTLYLDHVEPRDSIVDVPLICCRKTSGPTYKKDDLVWFYDDGRTGDENFNVTAECMLFPPEDEDKLLGAWLRWEVENPPFKPDDILQDENEKIIRILGVEGNEYRYGWRGLVKRDNILYIDRNFKKLEENKPKTFSELKEGDFVYQVNERYRIKELKVISNVYDDCHYAGEVYINSGYQLRLSNEHKYWLNNSEAKGRTAYASGIIRYFTMRKEAEDYVLSNYEKRLQQLDKQIKKATDERALLVDEVMRISSKRK